VPREQDELLRYLAKDRPERITWGEKGSPWENAASWEMFKQK